MSIILAAGKTKRLDVSLTPIPVGAGASYYGRITDFDTGEGIPAAKISLMDTSLVFYSVSNGNYTVPDLIAGEIYGLRFEKEGYISYVALWLVPRQGGNELNIQLQSTVLPPTPFRVVSFTPPDITLEYIADGKYEGILYTPVPSGIKCWQQAPYVFNNQTYQWEYQIPEGAETIQFTDESGYLRIFMKVDPGSQFNLAQLGATPGGLLGITRYIMANPEQYNNSQYCSSEDIVNIKAHGAPGTYVERNVVFMGPLSIYGFVWILTFPAGYVYAPPIQIASTNLGDNLVINRPMEAAKVKNLIVDLPAGTYPVFLCMGLRPLYIIRQVEGCSIGELGDTRVVFNEQIGSLNIEHGFRELGSR